MHISEAPKPGNPVSRQCLEGTVQYYYDNILDLLHSSIHLICQVVTIGT